MYKLLSATVRLIHGVYTEGEGRKGNGTFTEPKTILSGMWHDTHVACLSASVSVEHTASIFWAYKSHWYEPGLQHSWISDATLCKAFHQLHSRTVLHCKPKTGRTKTLKTTPQCDVTQSSLVAYLPTFRSYPLQPTSGQIQSENSSDKYRQQVPPKGWLVHGYKVKIHHVPDGRYS